MTKRKPSTTSMALLRLFQYENGFLYETGTCPSASSASPLLQKLIMVKEKQLTQKMRCFSGNLTIFANGM